MSVKYRYDHRSAKQRRRRIIGVLIGSVLIVALIVGALIWGLGRNSDSSSSGNGNTVAQVLNEGIKRLTVDESAFSFDLPGDWKEISRKNTSTEHSITWQATKKNEDNRSLTLYIDTIPTTKAVNRLVPVMAQNNTLSVGDTSDNCSTFTGGGSLNAQQAVNLKPAPAKWQKVDFICDLPRPIDNEVGTGSTDGINTVKVTGPSKGTHQYFFLFTDHNIQPNYSIFLDALRSFKAK
jgi:hypothetical protein